MSDSHAREGQKPDFYLSSREGYSLQDVRACYGMKRYARPYVPSIEPVLVRLVPPIIGQGFGLGGRDIEFAVLTPRHKGERVSAAERSSVDVHVARLAAGSAPANESLPDSELVELGWGEVFGTAAEAR